MIEYQIALHGYLQCFDGEGKVVEQPMQIHGLDGGYLTELPAPVPGTLVRHHGFRGLRR